MKIHGLVVAAGSGLRSGLEFPKQYTVIGGRSILSRSLAQLVDHHAVEKCTAVISPDHEELFRKSVEETIRNKVGIAYGGADRGTSVLRGMEAIAEAKPTHVLIHDGARPFLSGRLISAVVQALQKHDAAIPVVRSSDALWQVDAETLKQGLDRNRIRRAQTPQGFAFPPILAAYREYGGAADDDAGVAIAAGMIPVAVEGSELNMKLTWEEDFSIAEQLIARPKGYRTGFGFDVHRLETGDGVILCGVKIPFSQSLHGHSDADVALHAICDAIYGGLADGDIGRWFPPEESQWKSADSIIFLEHAAERAKLRGYVVASLDCTIVCEAPKIGPHADAMRKRIADCLGIALQSVSVKATTSEGLGFMGRGEGIAAYASVTLAES